MMHIHLDAVGGIAGDMFVAALLDAFPDLRERVLGDAMAVVPPQAGMAALTPGSSSSIACLRFGLHQNRTGLLPGKAPSAHGARFRDMVTRIQAAELAPDTAGHAIGILTVLAEAEASIHSVSVDEVHFHEVGDWDSLLDVVAAGSIIGAIGPAAWSVSALPRGGGLVRTQHGLLPVPAPATTAILTQFSFRDDGVAGERVTPTGAAILHYLDASGPGVGQGRLLAAGTGAGTRDLPGMPNILRALVFETDAQADRDSVTLISFEVDDMTGEEIGTAAELLRAEAGVLDVSLGQRQGKKSRPMQSFQIIASPERADQVIERCFLETSTIGLRRHDEARVVLRRQAATVGAVRTKTVERPGAATVKAENDDLRGPSLAERRAARQHAEGSAP